MAQLREADNPLGIVVGVALAECRQPSAAFPVLVLLLLLPLQVRLV